MHIDTIGTAIYLRDPQIDTIDHFFRKTGFSKIDICPSESLEAFRGNLGIVDAIAHDESSYFFEDSHLLCLAQLRRSMIRLEF
jgi:hypothetical protein